MKQLAMAGKRCDLVVHPKKKKECNKLDLTMAQYFSDWLIIMISSDGLLLVVLTYMQFEFQFYSWGCQKKEKAKLRHLNLSSRVTY